MLERQVPFIPQMESAECGAASLAMVMAYHGRHIPLVEVRQSCGVSRDGVTAYGILRAAREHGFEAEAVKAEVEDLASLPLPAILHWDFSHFVVLASIRASGYEVVDPALGSRKVRAAEFANRFTGVALVFAPSEVFQTSPRIRPSLKRYRDLLLSFKGSLFQVLIATLIIQVVGLAFPIGSQVLLDKVITPHRSSWLWALALGLGGATAGKILLSLVRSWVIQGLQAALDYDLMGQFMQHLLKLPMVFFLQRSAGDLAQRAQSNAQVRDLFTSSSVSVLLDVALLSAYALLMLTYNSGLGLVVLLIGAVRIVLLWCLKVANQQLMAMELSTGGRESGALVDALSALETVKASGSEGRIVMRWADRMVERVNASYGRRRLDAVSSQAGVFLQGLASALVIWLAGRLVMQGHMTVGVFASFLVLQSMFLAPLESLMEAARQMQFLSGHLARLDDVMEAHPEKSGTIDPGALQGAIELRDVSFAYSPDAPFALSKINLRIAAGEKVALVGPTGAGKSSLASLLIGMHLPTHGSIHFDGMNMRDIDLGLLRKQMGIVLQETFLFNDSIRANLNLGEDRVGEDQLYYATQVACISGFIDTLPMRFDTSIGENGGALSGGQRQRLALARALIKAPRVLLLDEATSALDLETEAKLHSNLAALGCTRIVIAHRLATVRDADRIFVIEGGSILQQGSYADLMAESGLFSQLVSAMGSGHA